ncbi:hypothetical protein [Herbaspirillum huttiense]|uniref:hypothetical protein n=1 Tax=Herbaspirillum huttiense TaxID=863372 RepID=UPI002E79E77E|nr:hypothetical protein [Herbaspirillum huttiense]MEE1638122.1 hypothetical protein [Herbaspirillum huttiense NC40101]
MAGNETITAQLEFTLDTTPPIKPLLALVRDTAGVAGSSVITTDTDKITSDGRVRITNAEVGTKIEYSFDNSNWLTVESELRSNGSSTHQRPLKRSDISLIGTNSPRDSHEFSATQTDLLGNTSATGATMKVRINTTPTAPLDLDASAAGIQTSSTLKFTLSQLNTGINLVGNVAPPERNDIEAIQVRFLAQGSNSATNQLIVGGTTLFMKDNLAQQNNQTIGTVMPMAKPSLFIRRAFWWRARRNRIPGPHQKNRQSMTARHRLPLRCC